MALIDATLAAKAAGVTDADWSGSGYAYLDGRILAGPETDGADLAVRPDVARAFEFRGESGLAIYRTRPIRPVLRWRPSSGATQYRVYHTPPGGSESTLLIVPHNADRDPYEEACPSDLAAGWHLFRVEALDALGNATTATAWPHYVYDLPELPSALAISGSGGSFDIELTE